MNPIEAEYYVNHSRDALEAIARLDAALCGELLVYAMLGGTMQDVVAALHAHAQSISAIEALVRV